MKPSDQVAIRNRAITRGLDYIYRVVNERDGFENYGSLATCCFALVSATSRDAKLRRMATSRVQTLGRRWLSFHPVVPPDATTDLVFNFLMVIYALSRIGVRNVGRNAQVNEAAIRFSALELLGFNPVTEPPPADLPYQCDCGYQNPRGRKRCKQCKTRLEFQSRYRVWMKALSNTYVGERCRVTFGAHHLDVLEWLPEMRPYPRTTEQDVELLRDAVYAVTHVVYTLNNYSTYRLRREWLRPEFAFLKANVGPAIERNDPEVLGELLDTLKAFGLRDTHPVIRRGTEFLLETQNEDGSWGDPDESIRTRCHTTWTAVDGLRKHAWRGYAVKPRTTATKYN